MVVLSSLATYPLPLHFSLVIISLSFLSPGYLLCYHVDTFLPKAQAGIEIPATPLEPGDWVLLKALPNQVLPLHPKWEGRYQVILTTPTAAKLLGIPAWIHLSRLKRAWSQQPQA